MKYLIWLSNVTSSIREVVEALKSQDIETDLFLIQDGVYMIDKGCPQASQINDLSIKVHALKHHVEERGIGGRLLVDANQVEYPEMVELLMEKYDKIISL
ncbi:MAG: sulfurtransferase complex subunit TusB [Candidatus Thorarchaeota archaeon]